ncbi:MAG TPA: glycoside hydrolase family 30 beta sandwich domain-containing protein [Gemmatimonadales bacterium]|nr:glycoside hydrolase family 30 beta sandwich domain-containing protein [Gemmatimonadales bacterium]
MRAVLAFALALMSACSGRGAAVWVTTGDQQKLLSREPDLSFSAGWSADFPIIEIADTGGFQEMVGFGAALTDASAILINGLPAEQRDLLLRELFDPDSGIGLSFTRLTIGASDFSPNHYTFDDMPRGQRDPLLARFSIEPDRANRLPVVRRARAINPALTVMASPWSAPAWMKTTDRLIKGSLRPDAYEAFAEYLARYVDAYAAEGVPIFALTIQNEPHFEPGDYPGMRVDPPARARFIGEFLGPRLARSGARTLIFDWDHNWDEPQSPLAVLRDSLARQYVDGVAWHCYGGDVTAQSIVHDSFPAVDAYFTECSGGEWAPKFADNLVWNVQQLIIGTTRNWARGVLLWNLALDETHGPHLGGCGNCRGVVTIDSKSGAITRNVEYYALAHASRFVKPGARRVASSGPVEGLENVAFRNPDRSSVLIVVNTTAEPRQFSVRWRGRGLQYVLPPSAVATFRWSG